MQLSTTECSSCIYTMTDLESDDQRNWLVDKPKEMNFHEPMPVFLLSFCIKVFHCHSIDVKKARTASLSTI